MSDLLQAYYKKMNGVLIKAKKKCAICGKYNKIATRTGSVYAVHTSPKGLLCRAHAKELRVI